MSWNTYPRKALAFAVAALMALAVAPLATAPLATAQDEARGVPTMLVLDNSGSMTTEDAGGQTRSDAAQDAAGEFIGELGDTLDLGLVTYGGNTGESPEEYEAGCRDISLVRGPEAGNPAELTDHIDDLEPRGYTPIGDSLRAAAEELPTDAAGTIVLVSDGIDTCAPPPVCEVAEELHDQGIDLVINTVGFNVDDEARAELECIADAGGGTYADAGDADELVDELKRATTRSARGYESELETLQGGDNRGDATPIPYDLDTFQAELPPMSAGDEDNLTFWSIPVEGYERVQVTTTYAEPTSRGMGGGYLSIQNALRMPGPEEDRCHRGLGGDGILDTMFVRPTVASVESDRIGVDCDTDELLLVVSRSQERRADEPLPVEIHVERLAPADVNGLPLGEQEREIADLDPIDVDTWTDTDGGLWFTDATELTSGEGVEAEIVAGESQFFRIPMRTGQQLRGYLEVVENSATENATATDLFGSAVYSPTRQSLRGGMRASTSLYEGNGDAFTSETPLTYNNMFDPEGGFGASSANVSGFSLEGDYFVVVSMADVAGDRQQLGDTGLPTVRYRLVAETVGDPEPGPVFENVSAQEETSVEPSEPEQEPADETTAAASEDEGSSGISGSLIGSVVAALVVIAIAVFGWLGLRKRR